MVGLMSWGAPEQGWRRGPWTAEEDKLLTEYVRLNGEGKWNSVAKFAGLNRNGKSCRLRWVNYLRPGLKKGHITPQEKGIIIELHALWGNKWSTIARYLPGRTDNEIKNYWRTHFKKKAKSSQKQSEKEEKPQVLHQKQQQHQAKDMTEVSSLAEEGNQRKNETQVKQEMDLMYPFPEDQCFPGIYEDVMSWSDTGLDDGLWGGLWNID